MKFRRTLTNVSAPGVTSRATRRSMAVRRAGSVSAPSALAGREGQSEPEQDHRPQANPKEPGKPRAAAGVVGERQQARTDDERRQEDTQHEAVDHGLHSVQRLIQIFVADGEGQLAAIEPATEATELPRQFDPDAAEVSQSDHDEPPAPRSPAAGAVALPRERTAPRPRSG